MAGRVLQAASEIMFTITQLMNARKVKHARIAEILPEMATTLERVAAELRAAAKYGPLGR